MASIGKIARRTFLVGVAAIAGGAAFGYYAYRREPENPIAKGLGPNAAALTPYVLVDASGVTIITPRTDLGQGAYSILAALVAEELDIELASVKIDHGPPSVAYYNGKVAAEGFPVAATAEGFGASIMRGLGDVAGKFLGLQLTGGSSTVSDGFDKMRLAGAIARETLAMAAAAQLGLDRSRLRTENGAVVTPDGQRIPYTALASAAARVTPPSTVALRPASAWRILGKPMKRLDIVAKSTGTATYGIDLRLPDMVYATVKANPALGAKVRSFDARAAEAARGVLKVVPVTGGVGVIATNTWRAFQAAELITFAWEPATYPPTTEAMFAEVAASFVAARQDSRFKDEGAVEEALKTGEAISAEYRLPYLAHAPLEPMNCVARMKDGALDIWTATQIPIFVVEAAKQITGLPTDRIRLHTQIAGGSFGRRLEDDFIRQTIELAKAYPGRPIKMTWSREEDFTHDFPRPLAIGRMRGKVAGGRVEAYDLSIAAPSVTTSQSQRLGQWLPGPDVAIVAGAWDQPFGIPHYRVTGYRAPPMAPISSWRSVGASGNGFLHDCFLDELIHAAKADPLAERIRLCRHEPSKRVLEAVGRMSGWSTPLPRGRGRGVAFTLSFGVPVAEVVEVTDTPSGIKIDKVFVAAEVGRVLDPVNFANQVKGGVIWGLGHAMNCELTFKDGAIEQTNFTSFEGMRLNQTPEIVVQALETTGEVKGIGEPSVPPAAPALANAIFAATGKRVRELPLSKHVAFA